MRAADPPLTLPPTLPEGPAGYGALVHAIAAAQAANHADPVTAGVHALAQAAQTAWQTRLAARLGLSWPLPDAVVPEWPTLPPLFGVPFFSRSPSPPERPSLGADAVHAMQAAQRWVQAGAAVVSHFDGLAEGTRQGLEAELATRPTQRPLRSLPALHGAFLRAWHRTRAHAVQAPALAQRLRDLGDTSAAMMSALRGLVPQAAVGH